MQEHGFLDELAGESEGVADELAERIRSLGGMVNANYAAYLTAGEVAEADNLVSKGKVMFGILLGDY